MIPLAFDLISTFVIGSTLPVATTDAPWAALDGGQPRRVDFVDAPLAVVMP